MGVGAADAEGGDGGAAGVFGFGPGDWFGEQSHGGRGPVDVGAGVFGVQGGGQDVVLRAWTILMIPATPAAAWVWPMLDLIDPSHRGRFRVAVGTVGGQQGAGFDGVAEGGAGAVGFDDVDVVRG